MSKQADKEKFSLKILQDSCLSAKSAYLCELSSRTKVTVIGAFYTDAENVVNVGNIVGKTLVLDFDEGGRRISGPIE